MKIISVGLESIIFEILDSQLFKNLPAFKNYDTYSTGTCPVLVCDENEVVSIQVSKGGIMIPEKAQQKVNEAVVIAVGQGARNRVCVNVLYQYISVFL